MRSKRRLDAASLMLLLVGILFGTYSFWIVAHEGISALVVIPSIVAITIGAARITKLEAPRNPQAKSELN